jgi:hypothetical protein
MSTPDPLDQIEYHLSQAMHLLHQYRGASGAPLPAELAGSLSRKSRGTNNKSLREWVAWLKRNQPAYRQEIWDATGLNLTAPKSSILDWTSDMAYWDDSQMPPDSLCRLRAPAGGPGAPPSIYFLWSQRFDIHALHGVGPSERPEPQPQLEPEPQTLLGVIHPPVGPATVPAPGTEPLTGEPLDGFGLPANDWDTYEEQDLPPKSEPTEPTRYATMDEWHARWDQVFDMLAANDAVATAEEKEQMLSTMPEDTEGEPTGTILARALHEAKQRVRSN